MTKYVALLRGINVGGRVIKKDELKACFEKMGLAGVRTVAQTGNVIFESDQDGAQLKNKIEESLSETFNYPAKAQVLSMPELAGIVNDYPFAPKEGYHSYVIFIENNLENDLAAEFGGSTKENVKAGRRVVYWQVSRGQTLKSEFAKNLAKPVYKTVNTNRNLNTLKKLLV